MRVTYTKAAVIDLVVDALEAIDPVSSPRPVATYVDYTNNQDADPHSFYGLTVPHAGVTLDNGEEWSLVPTQAGDEAHRYLVHGPAMLQVLKDLRRVINPDWLSQHMQGSAQDYRDVFKLLDDASDTLAAMEEE